MRRLEYGVKRAIKCYSIVKLNYHFVRIRSDDDAVRHSPVLLNRYSTVGRLCLGPADLFATFYKFTMTA